MKIYPAIDLMGGRVVRLIQGRFDAVTDYEKIPAKVAENFAAAGASSLHMVDLDGARDGSVRQDGILREIVQHSQLSVQVGGGIRSVAQAQAYLEAGAARVVVGSLAVQDRLATESLLSEVGPDKVTLAFDFLRNLRGEIVAASHGWKERSDRLVLDLIDHYSKCGVAYFLCTDVGRDGMMNGPDVALYRDWQGRFPAVEIQVSGGVGSLAHLQQLRAAEAKAVIVGKALYEGAFALEEALQC